MTKRKRQKNYKRKEKTKKNFLFKMKSYNNNK